MSKTTIYRPLDMTQECNDCGEKGIIATHSGIFVPDGESGSFCERCWHIRLADKRTGISPRKIGFAKVGYYSKSAVAP